MGFIAIFMAGAMVGMVIVSLTVMAGRCDYEEEVRQYYETYYREEGKHE